MKKIKLPGWRSILGTIIFLIAAITVSNYSGLTQSLLPGSAVSVTVMPVSTLSKPVRLMLPGAVEGANSTVITAEIAGQIMEVNVKEGQAVNPGQSLIKIQGSGISTAQAHFAAPAESNTEIIAAAQANYDTLQMQYARYQKLLEQGAIARRQVEDLEARLAAAREALNNTKNASVPAISIPGETTVQNVLANLTSSTGGIVKNLAAVPGAAVQAGQALLVVDSGSDVQVIVELAQKDLYAVHSGTPVEILLTDNSETTTAGQVQGIFPQAGPNAAFFRTQIRLDNSAGLLKSGMTVKVRIDTPSSTPVQAVPTAAVCHDQDEDYVYLSMGGKAVRQTVTVGDKIGEFVEITSQLPEGAQVIMTNLKDLKNGADIILQ